jgi:hypothetical protein
MGGLPVVMFLSAGHCGTDRLAEAIGTEVGMYGTDHEVNPLEIHRHPATVEWHVGSGTS